MVGAVEGETAGKESQDKDLPVFEVGEFPFDAVGVRGVEKGGGMVGPKRCEFSA